MTGKGPQLLTGTAVELTGVTKSFGDVQALDGADLSVLPGTLVAVLGPSGCGKTTLLRAVAGFERIDGGTIAVGGHCVAGPGVHVPPEGRQVGIVPQDQALFPHLTVAKNVGFGLDRKPGRAERVDAMLELAGLPGLGDRMPHELSGGQQQRVALARALAPAPSVVLLDEPFANLDAALRVSIRTEVREILRASGATALFVTHDQEEALSTADVVAVMHAGRVIQAGIPEEIYRRPADPWVAGLRRQRQHARRRGRRPGQGILRPGRDRVPGERRRAAAAPGRCDWWCGPSSCGSYRARWATPSSTTTSTSATTPWPRSPSTTAPAWWCGPPPAPSRPTAPGCSSPATARSWPSGADGVGRPVAFGVTTAS